MISRPFRLFGDQYFVLFLDGNKGDKGNIYIVHVQKVA